MKRKVLQEEREEWRRREFRRCIVAAAEKVIVAKGYAGMTMDDVAREAQFSKATLYHYFRSKGELLLEILGHFFEEIEQGIRKINRLPQSAAERLRKGLHFYLHYNEEKENISRMLMLDRSFTEKMNIFVADESRLTSDVDRRFITKMKTKRNEILNGAADLLNEGVASGEFREMNVASAVVFLESLLQGYCHIRMWHEKPFSAKTAAGHMIDLFLRGIEKKDGPAKGASR
jgi:AcrR family transcriptional regulator